MWVKRNVPFLECVFFWNVLFLECAQNGMCSFWNGIKIECALLEMGSKRNLPSLEFVLFGISSKCAQNGICSFWDVIKIECALFGMWSKRNVLLFYVLKCHQLKRNLLFLECNQNGKLLKRNVSFLKCAQNEICSFGNKIIKK